MPGPTGQIMHAELKIGDSIVMLSDENPQRAMSPQTAGGVSVCFHLYVENVDEVVQKAVAGGAKSLRPVKNQFYGDRQARCSIRSGTCGQSRPMWKTSRPRR